MMVSLLQINGFGSETVSAAETGGVWSGSTDTKWYDNKHDATEFYISTAEELAGLATIVNNGTDSFKGKTIYLMNNIQLNNTVDWESWGKDTVGLNKWTPIGNYNNMFKGVFEGNNHCIKGLYMVDIKRSTSYQSLFGTLDEGTIRDLGIEESYQYGGYDSGSIVGKIYNNSLIENCYSTSNMDGFTVNGGIVGSAAGSTINYCVYKGNINGGYVGGISGWSAQTTIKNCYNYGNVCGNPLASYNYKIGGIVGELAPSEKTNIINCYNYGKVYSDCNRSTAYIGGISGGWVSNNSNGCRIDKCMNYGEISYSKRGNQNAYIGGISGIGITLLSNSANKGNIYVNCSRIPYVGSLIGSSNSYCKIINSYNNGQININGSYKTCDNFIGLRRGGTLNNTYSYESENNSGVYYLNNVAYSFTSENNSWFLSGEGLSTNNLLDILKENVKANSDYLEFVQGSSDEKFLPQFAVYNVHCNIENINLLYGQTVFANEDFEGKLASKNETVLPEEITVSIGDKELIKDKDYIYNYKSGKIVIYKVNGNVDISNRYKDAETSVNTSDDIVFDGNEIKNGEDFTINTNSKGKISYSYVTKGGSDFTPGLPVNAGNYVIKAEIAKDKVNFINETTITFEVTIKKAIPEVNEIKLNALYGETLKDMKLPDGYTFNDDLSTSVGNVGNNKFVLTYTPEDLNNYESVNVDGEITVKGMINLYNEGNLFKSLCYGLNEDIVYPDSPTKIGYTFVNWSTIDGLVYNKMPETSIDLYSQYKANKDTKYISEYYLEDFKDGEYSLNKSDILSGTTDTNAKINIKEYKGFTFNKEWGSNVLSGNINGDGTLVLKAYYRRNNYKAIIHNEEGFKINEVNKDDSYLKYGGNYDFTIDINNGYRKSDNFKVIVNNNEIKSDENGVYSINNIESNLEIEVLGVVNKTTHITKDTIIDNDISIIEGDTLIIDEGVILTNNSVINLNGTIINRGTLINDGSIINNGKFINEGKIIRNIEKQENQENQIKLDHYIYNNIVAYYTNEELKIEASGKYYDDTEYEIGDYRYVPVSYNLGSEDKVFDDYSFSAKESINAEGTYTLKVTFEKEIFDGTNWVKNGENDIKELTILVKNKNEEKVNKVYLHMPSGWTKPYIYVYENKDGKVNELGKWPGVQMEYEYGDIYSYTIPSEYENPLVLFSNNGDNTTQIPARNVKGFEVNGVMIYDEDINSLISYDESDINLYISKFESNKPLVQPVNRDITFSAKANGGKGPYIYVFKVNGEKVQVSLSNKMTWNAKEVGRYNIELDVIDSLGNVVNKTMEYTIKDKESFQSKIIYKGVENPYIYYKLGNGSWIKKPGIKMIKSNIIDGYYEYTIELEEENENVTLCFNNGANNWDSIGGKNYYVSSGEYVIHNTKVAKVNTSADNKITIKYKGFYNPYIHYCIGNTSWTSGNGVIMQKSDTLEGYYEYTIDCGIFDYAYVTFNDGKGKWDNNKGCNYRLTTGSYIFD
ncbi:MAG: starch-binding protein [Clostridiales bacterium]|nr:starch-binding protein [Clostridiales bacterium]